MTSRLIKSQLAVIDNLDDRREIAYMLSIMTPYQRTRFLYRCCDIIGPIGQTPCGKGIVVTISNETGDYRETFLDLMQMISQYGLDAKRCVEELEKFVKEIGVGSGTIIVPESPKQPRLILPHA